MQAFSLDSESGIPVKLQLKAHVKYQIMAGTLRPGDQLPPLRDLAAGLGINLNTVVRAFGELEAEGYLYSRPGKGVFVADEFPGQGHGAALRSLLAGVLGPAREWGMTPEEIAMALLACGQLARAPKAVSHRLLLVAGSRAQLRRLQGELEAVLPVMVEPALPEELPEKVRVQDYGAVACTLFHQADCRHCLPGATVVPLAGSAAREIYARLDSLEPGTPVAVTSRDWLHAARVRSSLERSGLGHLKLDIAAGQTPAALAPALQQARFALVTPDCREIAREALGGAPSTTLLTEPTEVPAEALAALRAILGAPAQAKGVTIRSAWV
ncbi:MAG TPA: GntR family transcriptional regulator [Symbiobacteriaceae bacterium]|jgi:GntR family transcriptional regulator